MLARSLTHSLTHSLAHSLARSLTHSLAHSLTARTHSPGTTGATRGRPDRWRRPAACRRGGSLSRVARQYHACRFRRVSSIFTAHVITDASLFIAARACRGCARRAGGARGVQAGTGRVATQSITGTPTRTTSDTRKTCFAPLSNRNRRRTNLLREPREEGLDGVVRAAGHHPRGQVSNPQTATSRARPRCQ